MIFIIVCLLIAVLHLSWPEAKELEVEVEGAEVVLEGEEDQAGLTSNNIDVLF